MDQGEKLLIEDDEIALLDLLSALDADDAIAEEPFRTNRIDVEALLGKALPEVRPELALSVCSRTRPRSSAILTRNSAILLFRV